MLQLEINYLTSCFLCAATRIADEENKRKTIDVETECRKKRVNRGRNIHYTEDKFKVGIECMLQSNFLFCILQRDDTLYMMELTSCDRGKIKEKIIMGSKQICNPVDSQHI